MRFDFLTRELNCAPKCRERTVHPSWPSRTDLDPPVALVRNHCIQATARGWELPLPHFTEGEAEAQGDSALAGGDETGLQPYTTAGLLWTYCVHHRGLSCLEIL